MLDTEYAKLIASTSSYEKTQVGFTVINIKIDNPAIMGHFRPLYDDVKAFISDYVKSVDTLSYGYDSLNLNKIFKVIDSLPTKEGMALNNYLIRLLRNNGYESEFKESIKNKNKLKLKDSRQHSPNWFPFRWILYHSSKSFESLVITVLLFLLFIFVVLLPTDIEAVQLFKIEYDDHSDIFLVNHGFNLICNALEMGQGFSIVPLNLFGLTLIIIGKVAFVILVGNFLIQEITRKLAE